MARGFRRSKDNSRPAGPAGAMMPGEKAKNFGPTVKKLIGNANPLLVALGVDAELPISMIYTISHKNRFGKGSQC